MEIAVRRPQLKLPPSFNQTPLSFLRKPGLEMDKANQASRQRLLSSGSLSEEAKGIITGYDLYPAEIGLLALVDKYLSPLLSCLPNENAIAIACYRFEEAIPWIKLTSGFIHGIDQIDNLSFLGISLKEALQNGLINENQARRIGYGFSLDGDARKRKAYQTKKYGKFGVAFLRHPDVFNIHAYAGNNYETYVKINEQLVKNVLAVNGIGLITTYTSEEMNIYRKLLQPYQELGIISFGLFGSNGKEILRPGGIRNIDTMGTLGSDNIILGFRKLRKIHFWEMRRINKAADIAYKDALHK